MSCWTCAGSSSVTEGSSVCVFFQAEDGIRDIGGDWSSDVCSSDLVSVFYEERQDLAQRGSPPNIRGEVHRGLQFTFVALGQPRDVLGLGDAYQAPLLIDHEDVGQAGLPHPPQDHGGALVLVGDLPRS